MLISRIQLENWRNFRKIDTPLLERQFIVGPNASGKSNFLDALRFLRDIAKQEGGGLQKAISDRGGISKIRSLHARKEPYVRVSIELKDRSSSPESLWKYAIGIKQQSRGHRQPYLEYEKVWSNETLIVNRPDKNDRRDEERLKQTFLEQINSNQDFRNIARYFESITYLHLVPQLLRYSDVFKSIRIEDDPFGQGFLEKIAKVNKRTRESRLRKIERALRVAVPQLKNLEFERDLDTGQPHLRALYEHWRPEAGWQREDQFSDGTLRLLGLLWSLLESDSLLLLEEPELSLNQGIVRQIAPLVYRLQRDSKRQVLVTTHSEALLTDGGISGNEVLILTPMKEGTDVTTATSIQEIKRLLDTGLSVGEVIGPRIAPRTLNQLSLFSK